MRKILVLKRNMFWVLVKKLSSVIFSFFLLTCLFCSFPFSLSWLDVIFFFFFEKVVYILGIFFHLIVSKVNGWSLDSFMVVSLEEEVRQDKLYVVVAVTSYGGGLEGEVYGICCLS